MRRSVAARGVAAPGCPPLTLLPHSYPPSPPKAALGKLTFGLQMLGLGVTLGGQHIFPPPHQPAWLKTLQENKLQSAMFVWFIGAPPPPSLFRPLRSPLRL